MKQDDLFAPPSDLELESLETQDNLFDAPSEEELSEIETDDGEMGVAEAGITGIGQGASLGLTPIVSGIAGAGMEAVEDIGDALGLTTDAELREKGFDIKDDKEGLKGLVDAYYESRDAQIKQEEKAFEDQPIATMAGGIVGGLPVAGAASKATGALAKILPKLESIKGLSKGRAAAVAAREGAKAGGLAGFGSGDAKLLEGELGKTAQDLGEGVAGGAALGGALSGTASLAKGVGRIVKDSPLGTFGKLGYDAAKKKLDLFDNEKVLDYIGNTTKELKDELLESFQGKSKQKMLKEADSAGVRIAAGDTVENIVQDIKDEGAFGKNEQKRLISFIKDLENKFKKTIKDEVSEEVPIKQYEMQSMKPTELEELTGQIGNIAFAKSDDPATQYARRLYSNLRELSNEALQSDNISDRNKKLADLYNSLDSLGIKSEDFFSKREIVEDKVLRKMRSKFLADPISGSGVDASNFQKYVNRVNSELGKKIKTESDFMSNIAELESKSEGLGVRASLGPFQKLMTLPGSTTSKVEDSAKALSNMAKGKLDEITPDSLSNVLETFSDQISPSLRNVIESTTNQPEQRRTAAIYSLNQMPEFREFVQSIGKAVTGKFLEPEENESFTNYSPIERSTKKEQIEQEQLRKASEMSQVMKSSEDSGVSSMGRQLESAMDNNDDLDKTMWSMNQQPAFREVLRRQRAKDTAGKLGNFQAPMEADSENRTSELNSILDSYSKMVSSGDDTPEYELDQAMGEIDNLELSDEIKQSLKDSLIMADTPSKVEELKNFIRSVVSGK